MNQYKIRLGLAVAILAGIALTAFAQTFPSTEGFRVTDTFTDVKKKLNQSGATIGTLSTGTSVAFPITVAKGGTGATNASKAQLNLGIAAGSAASTSDGTATITFSPVFSAAPKVVVSPVAVSVGTNHVSVTSSNFVWTCGANGVTFNWVAVGTP
jgi:hypothetical protein